ncbi:hypothetical protein STRDD10_00079 [Streptococcus sp. DD10]|uniref:DUF1273 domain-containing protein n=1 Tax=Streptococcus sp. DD10 TaxID=1777878 RepID=UPI00079121D9|nr:DUF1273 domain-containing protein [Streptococcus sp. DD10]KXT77166.1 hypothetical protein STRDD10_00079 [Streptococcus sp. DD10]
MTSLLVTGYRSFEIGVFNEKDMKVKVIKSAIRQDLIRFLENGVDWLIFTGSLGFEVWVLEVANELRVEGYEVQTASIFPFQNHGENWNEVNQIKLTLFKNCDFFKAAYPCYENPGQFRDYNQFLLNNTESAYVFYDEEHETNLKYLYQMMINKDNYEVKVLRFDDLNEVAENF